MRRRIELNKQSRISEAVDASIEITSGLFGSNEILLSQEEIDKLDDLRRINSRLMIRGYLDKLKKLGEENQKIQKLAFALEADYERSNREEDFLEFLDDAARATNIRCSEKIIFESRELNKQLEEIHLEKHKKDKRAAAGTTTL